MLRGSAATEAPRATGTRIEFNAEALARAGRELKKYPHLSGVHDALVKELARAVRDEALRRYHIGRLVQTVRDDANKYGGRAVETLATLIGYDKSTLHDYANVAQLWDTKAFGSLLKRKNSLGLPLRFSHLVTLIEVTDARMRERLIARTLTESLTVRQLEQVVRHGDAREATAETPPATADKIRRIAATWEAARDRLAGDTRELIKLTTAQRTPELVRLVRQAAEQQRKLAAAASRCAEELIAAVAKER